MRKGLIGIQLYMFNKQRLKNIKVKNQRRMEAVFMTAWVHRLI